MSSGFLLYSVLDLLFALPDVLECYLLLYYIIPYLGGLVKSFYRLASQLALRSDQHSKAILLAQRSERYSKIILLHGLHSVASETKWSERTAHNQYPVLDLLFALPGVLVLPSLVVYSITHKRPAVKR